jgi:hypothetical protein
MNVKFVSVLRLGLCFGGKKPLEYITMLIYFQTVFEIGQSSRSRSYAVMKSTRAKHQSLIENHKRKIEDKEKDNLSKYTQLIKNQYRCR